MFARLKAPFDYKDGEEFHENLVDWIGDVLYDILPEYGYKIRDEQIFTAFQIADAFCNEKVHLAEAGLGTGKTFAYLLSAIPYARFSKKPVVIACASTALQEQLAGEKGDIKTLSKVLGMDIDSRMAKDPCQYVCSVKANETIGQLGEKSDEVLEWINQTKLGERSEMPTLPDSVWKRIGWDESMPCETCLEHGFCKLTKARESYKTTCDLIIVDHETFFHDLWTRKERLEDGKLPILPGYSAVIFDEGHKIMLPAMMQAGYQISQEEIQNMIDSLKEIQGNRYSQELAIASLEESCNEFFQNLSQSLISAQSEKRLSININDLLLKSAKTFDKSLNNLLLELQIEQELYTESLSTTLIQACEGKIEKTIGGLHTLCKNRGINIISWVDKKDGSLWVIPGNLSELLNLHLFQKGFPVVFTSATLSSQGDFDYLIRILGLEKPSKSSVGSPFDIENRVTVYLPQAEMKISGKISHRIEKLVSLLKKNGGRALVVVNTLKEVENIRKGLKGYQLPFEILWEDKGERGYLLRKFKEEETSVLIGTNFWEGIDVPGDALNLLVVWQLPFPALDPLIEAQRRNAVVQGLDPLTTVDYPEMGLKLKQGCGRLIRAEDDRGAIAILDSVFGTQWEEVVMSALPVGAKINEFKM